MCVFEIPGVGGCVENLAIFKILGIKTLFTCTVKLSKTATCGPVLTDLYREVTALRR